MTNRIRKIYCYQFKNNERFYSMPFFNGLAQCGVEVIWNEFRQFSPAGLSALMADIQPDLVLFYGFSFTSLLSRDPDRLFLEELGIPYAVIFCDNPLRYRPYLHSLDRTLGHFFCCDSQLATEMQALGYRCNFLPLSFDPMIDYPHPPNPMMAHDIIFPGTVKNAQHLAARKSHFTVPMMAIIDSIYQQRQANPGKYIHYSRQIADALPIPGIPSPDHLGYSLLCHQAVYEQKFQSRLELCTTLQEMDFHIYGNETWDATDTAMLHPFLNQHTELPTLYSSAKIITCTELLPASCHQRVFEASGCGGFILSEAKADTEKLFDLDTETVVYTSLNDLREKVLYYVANTEKRQQIATAARKRALAHHTCKIRAQEFLAMITQYR